ncbi:hypothetical protein [Photorhabdus luminescens]|uniref:Uncharacterized protein n=1 Tax=Photorhabdus luminescens subsp. sonorensis TaxID=1173677 RepID=A0A5C4RMR2_PHOLU|nr:hypothetical protein [Photorhabdus luminescens]TNH45340.1 hypothetical protein EP164_01210 [Photorhabdus luminescens subsp. sonorensis]
MSEGFTWSPDISQTYTKRDGTQAIKLPPSSSFDKEDNTNFTMEAPDEILTLQNNSDKTSIYWPVFHGNMADDGKIFNLDISAGTLKVDYTSENRDHTVAYFGCAENASFNLKDSGILKITNPGTVFMFIDYITLDKNKSPKLTMSGNSQFEIKQIKKIQSNSPAFIFLASDIYLHGSSQFTLESSDLYLGDGNFNYCNINIYDNSIVNLSNNGIMLRYGIDEGKTKFNIRAGNPLLSISSFSGINFPIDLDNVKYPEGLFHFITTEGENKGKVMIDIPTPDSKDTNFGDKIFSKKLIALDDKIGVQEYFNVSYGTAIRQGHQVTTIKISLKPEYQSPQKVNVKYAASKN